MKTSKLKGMAKLEDANDAGTRYSADCTLILTEGDSAKALVVSGFSVVGRDKYGVFPLRGKLLNVRDATPAKVRQMIINTRCQVTRRTEYLNLSGPCEPIFSLKINRKHRHVE